jgi:pimeloyl-ACP methyl ester carboxylesterase
MTTTEPLLRLTAATPFTEHLAAFQGGSVRYLEAGNGPALVHLHGGGGLELTPAHDLLVRHHRVIAIEMPGFGRSTDDLGLAGGAEMAAAMAAVIESLGVAPVALWGTSFGGKIATLIALDRPELVSALVLEAPAAIRAPGGPPRRDPVQMAKAFHAHPERLETRPPPPADPAARARTMQLVERLLGPPRDEKFETRLSRLEIPTLVTFGTEDGVIPPSMGPIWKRLVPEAHLVYLYDAAHKASIDRPEAFAEVVDTFLRRKSDFAVSDTSTILFP